MLHRVSLSKNYTRCAGYAIVIDPLTYNLFQHHMLGVGERGHVVGISLGKLSPSTEISIAWVYLECKDYFVCKIFARVVNLTITTLLSYI